MKEEVWLSKGLSDDERDSLFEMMDHPGWGVLNKLCDDVRKNWLDQTVNTDYTKDEDAVIIKKLLYRQGLLNGAKKMLIDLEKQKIKMNSKVVQKK